MAASSPPRPSADATKWSELATRLGHPTLVRHGLRHTALTWMADAGVSLDVLQKVAGHLVPRRDLALPAPGPVRVAGRWGVVLGLVVQAWSKAAAAPRGGRQLRA
ncbi:tyrosine-type recombinase/integrase [Jiangella ureilytica]|uniref:tyrosine-type recombinase/integrase n=1 Tax=Jiangella ureilytica TaxID=2530374 RepID=UPI003B8338FC